MKKSISLLILFVVLCISCQKNESSMEKVVTPELEVENTKENVDSDDPEVVLKVYCESDELFSLEDPKVPYNIFESAFIGRVLKQKETSNTLNGEYVSMYTNYDVEVLRVFKSDIPLKTMNYRYAGGKMNIVDYVKGMGDFDGKKPDLSKMTEKEKEGLVEEIFEEDFPLEIGKAYLFYEYEGAIINDKDAIKEVNMSDETILMDGTWIPIEKFIKKHFINDESLRLPKYDN